MSNPLPNDPPPTAPEQARPALDYAIPRRADPPAHSSELDALIRSGAEPAAIQRYFSHTSDAVRYYADCMSQRFSSENLRYQCVDCGAQAPLSVLQLEWNVKLEIRRSEFALTGIPPSTTFTTLHPVCERCASDWVRRLRFDRLRTFAVGAGTVLAGLAVIVGFFERASRDLEQLVGVWVFFSGLFVLTIICSRLARRWVRSIRPAGINRIMSTGVKFIRLARVIPREELAEGIDEP